MIRLFELRDLPELLKIYNFYVETSIATLDHKKASFKKFSNKLKTISKRYPCFVYEKDGKILGYCYASLWKEKDGYNKTVESTIYISQDHNRNGVGTKLYRHLIAELKRLNYEVVIGCLSLPNAISVALHEKLGFMKVAHFPGIGYKFDKKIDVGYWQLNLVEWM